MKKYFGLAATLALLCSPSLLRAQFNVTAQVGGIPSVSSAVLQNLDGSMPSFLTLAGNGSLVTGSEYPTYYAAPYLSGATAAYFGETPGSGPDASQYLALEVDASATFTFSAPQDYLGLLWGSVDTYNSLSFYNGQGGLIGTVTGTDVTGSPALADGDVGINNTFYVNITSTVPFSKVVANTGWNAFEIDDVAYAASVVPVPEPPTTSLIACGLGLLFLLVNRKRV